MSKPQEAIWGGGHSFKIYDPSETSWNDVPGVYIFAGLDSTGGWWQAKYIGRTNSFKDRIPNHERWEEARQTGATHVHARVVQGAAQQIEMEDALIRAYLPPLNSRTLGGYSS